MPALFLLATQLPMNICEILACSGTKSLLTTVGQRTFLLPACGIPRVEARKQIAPF